MLNISNQEIDADLCTKCSNCKKASWYVMRCTCGKEFCQYCSISYPDKCEDSDIINLICPDCSNFTMYV